MEELLNIVKQFQDKAQSQPVSYEETVALYLLVAEKANAIDNFHTRYFAEGITCPYGALHTVKLMFEEGTPDVNSALQCLYEDIQRVDNDYRRLASKHNSSKRF